MEDWKSRWNGLGRYGERQWTWDATEAHDARNWYVEIWDKISV